MSSLKKFLDGPKKFDEKDYEAYHANLAEHPRLGAYDFWLNEDFPDAHRVLALRALLRDSCPGEKFDPETHEELLEALREKYPGDPGFLPSGHDAEVGENFIQNHVLYRIYHCDDESIADALRHELQNRPKLRQEIISEFYWNLQHGYVKYYERPDSWRDVELLELLLGVAGAEDAKKLWAFHPLKLDEIIRDDEGESRLSAHARIKMLLRLANQRSGLQSFPRDEIWETIESEIGDIITAESENLQDENSRAFHGDPTTLAMLSGLGASDQLVLREFRDYIVKESTLRHRRDEDLIIRGLMLLEYLLPSNVLYLDQRQLHDILPWIRLNNDQNIALVQDMLRRFFAQAHPESTYHLPPVNFYYLVRGIMTRHMVDADRYVGRVDEYIECKTQHLRR